MASGNVYIVLVLPLWVTIMLMGECGEKSCTAKLDQLHANQNHDIPRKDVPLVSSKLVLLVLTLVVVVSSPVAADTTNTTKPNVPPIAKETQDAKPTLGGLTMPTETTKVDEFVLFTQQPGPTRCGSTLGKAGNKTSVLELLSVEDCASITATMLPKPTNWPLSTKTNKTSTTELLLKQQPQAAATPAQPHVATDLILAT